MAQQTAAMADKRVLVTGASSGIGSALALGFAEAGARVAIHYNSNADAAQRLADEARDLGAPDARIVQGDFTDPEVPARVVTDAIEALGGLDVLVNNAGDLMVRTTIAEVTDENLDAILQLNFLSVIRTCRAAIPAIRAAKGTIINVSSVTAKTGGSAGVGLYAAAKGGVNSLTYALAKELAPDKIRVNALSPGIVYTPLHDRHTSKAGLEERVGRIPLGRLGDPRDLVGAALFLASEDTANFITGQVFEINGGMHMG